MFKLKSSSDFMKTSLAFPLKAGVIALAALSTAGSAHATLIHQYEAADAPGPFTFADSVGSVNMAARDTAGQASPGAIVDATTVKTGLTKAFTITTNNTEFTRTSLSPNAYTLKIWTRLPGGTNPSANAATFETGGGGNGFGIFTVNGALEFATYCGTAPGNNNNRVSLSTTTLDTSDYLQLAALYNTANNTITFQIQDVNGDVVSGTDSSGRSEPEPETLPVFSSRQQEALMSQIVRQAGQAAFFASRLYPSTTPFNLTAVKSRCATSTTTMPWRAGRSQQVIML
jgi:hypothetical protein